MPAHVQFKNQEYGIFLCLIYDHLLPSLFLVLLGLGSPLEVYTQWAEAFQSNKFTLKYLRSALNTAFTDMAAGNLSQLCFFFKQNDVHRIEYSMTCYYC